MTVAPELAGKCPATVTCAQPIRRTRRTNPAPLLLVLTVLLTLLFVAAHYLAFAA